MPSMVRFIIAIAVFALPLTGPGGGSALAQKRAVPSGGAEIQLSFAPIVRKVGPAVVNIYTKRVVQQRPASPFFDDPFFRRFFGESSPSAAAGNAWRIPSARA